MKNAKALEIYENTRNPPKAQEIKVDILTVSRWLGHKDGGALAMKVYCRRS